MTAFATATSSPLGIAVASVGSAVLFAKWVFDIYQNTFVAHLPFHLSNADFILSPSNIACIMGYIVDLTIVMHRLFTVDMSEEHVISVLEDYVKSGEIAQVHNNIRKFVNNMSTLRLANKDYTLDEIIRLIENHVQ